jgi:hypothetical protein
MKIRNVLIPLIIMMAGSLSGCVGGPDEAEARAMFFSLLFQGRIFGIFPDKSQPVETGPDFKIFAYGTPDVMQDYTHENNNDGPISSARRTENQFMHMTIYLEGDTLAWDKPYPQRDAMSSGSEMMMKKALTDPSPALLLTLPCDPVISYDNCRSDNWRKKRFSKAVVSSINQKLDSLIARKGIVQFSFVAFGSGASLALAVAGTRHDINSVTTLSGVLDPLATAKAAAETDLEDVDDPLAYAKKLAKIPQRHYVVDRQGDASLALVDSFAKKVGGSCIEVVKVPDSASFSWSSVSYQQMNFPGPRCR